MATVETVDRRILSAEAAFAALFFAWRKRLAGDDAVPGRGRSRPIENGRDQSSFIELPLSAWPTKGVQITLPGGAVVVLPPDASSELVVAAIRAAMKPAAEARPC